MPAAGETIIRAKRRNPVQTPAGVSTRARLAYFVRTAIGSMVRSPFVHVIAVAALALSLVGFGLARIAGSQLDALVEFDSMYKFD